MTTAFTIGLILGIAIPLIAGWRKESDVEYLLRIRDDPDRKHPTLVFNHRLIGKMSPMRLKEIVYCASREHSEAFVYQVDGEIERCVAACHEGGLPSVSMVE